MDKTKIFFIFFSVILFVSITDYLKNFQGSILSFFLRPAKNVHHVIIGFASYVYSFAFFASTFISAFSYLAIVSFYFFLNKFNFKLKFFFILFIFKKHVKTTWIPVALTFAFVLVGVKYFNDWSGLGFYEKEPELLN